MTSRYNQRLQILLTEDQLTFLKKTADERGRSVAEIIREAVELVYHPRSGFQALSALRILGEKSILGPKTWSDLKERFIGRDR